MLIDGVINRAKAAICLAKNYTDIASTGARCVPGLLPSPKAPSFYAPDNGALSVRPVFENWVCNQSRTADTPGRWAADSGTTNQ